MFIAAIIICLIFLSLFGGDNCSDYKKTKEFKNQKTKVEIITAFSDKEIENIINQFIYNKKIISINVDREERGFCSKTFTATIMYENI